MCNVCVCHTIYTVYGLTTLWGGSTVSSGTFTLVLSILIGTASEPRGSDSSSRRHGTVRQLLKSPFMVSVWNGTERTTHTPGLSLAHIGY